MNLYDVLMGAQGGQGVNALANQFGLSPPQTQAAVEAMLPAFSLGLQKAVQDSTNFGALLGQMMNAANAVVYANPMQAAAVPGLGAAALGQIFGSPQVAQQIGLQAAQASGVSAQVVQQMMPLVAAMLIGGVASALAAQGLGGWIAQLANAFAAGMAPAASSRPGAQATAADFVASWTKAMGGALPGAAPQTAALQAGLSAFDNLLQAGVKVSEAQQKGLSEMLDSISRAAKP